MHEGCSGQYMTGKEIADKVRTMGFDDMPMAAPLDINCENCTKSFIMETMVSRCPHCEMVYAVTPCHSHRADSVLPAGIRYYPK